MTTTHVGKIGHLPKSIRDQLNRRLQDGQTGTRLVKWLNSLPETKNALAADFGGRDINEVNLTEWKQGGYQDWLASQELRACVGNVAEDGQELATISDGSLANHLATVLSARYAALMSGWKGEMNDDFQRQTRALGLLCHGIAQLRRGDYHLDRLQLDRERFAEASQDDQARALEGCLDLAKQWPDARQALRDAFVLLHQRSTGKPSPAQPPPDPPQNPAELNLIKPN